MAASFYLPSACVGGDLLQKSTGMPAAEIATCRLSQALEADDTEQVQQFQNTGMSPDVALNSSLSKSGSKYSRTSVFL